MYRAKRITLRAVAGLALALGCLFGIIGASTLTASAAGASGYTPASTSAVVTAKATVADGGTLRAAFCSSTSGASGNVLNECSLTQQAYTRAVSVAAATRSSPATPSTVAYWDDIAPGQTVALGVNDLYATNEGTGTFVVTYGPSPSGSRFETITVYPLTS